MKGLVEIINRETERVFIVGVQLKGQDAWCIDESLDELEELVGTAGGKVAGRGTQRLDRVNAATFIGPGKARVRGAVQRGRGGHGGVRRGTQPRPGPQS